MDQAKIIYLIGLIINITIYLLYLHKTDDKKSTTNIKHKTLRKIIRIISIFFFGLIVPVTAITVYPQGNYNVSDNLIKMGIPFIILSIAIMLESYRTAQPKFIENRDEKNDKFIVKGIYKYVRHPMYLAGIIFLIAQGILLPNKIGMTSSIIAISILIASKIPEEEKLLIHEFGFEYLEYMKTSAELIPFLL